MSTPVVWCATPNRRYRAIAAGSDVAMMQRRVPVPGANARSSSPRPTPLPRAPVATKNSVSSTVPARSIDRA